MGVGVAVAVLAQGDCSKENPKKRRKKISFCGLYNGQGVIPNNTKAAELFQQAAGQGHARAQVAPNNLKARTAIQRRVSEASMISHN